MISEKPEIIAFQETAHTKDWQRLYIRNYIVFDSHTSRNNGSSGVCLGLKRNFGLDPVVYEISDFDIGVTVRNVKTEDHILICSIYIPSRTLLKQAVLNSLKQTITRFGNSHRRMLK